MNQSILLIFDFLRYSLKKLLKIFSFGCLSVIILIIFVILFMYLILTGKYELSSIIIKLFL